MRFTTSAALVAWMQDEGLTELTISDLQRAPADVRFTWWLHGVGNGKRVPFRVHARGVTRFDLDGPCAEGAVTIDPPDDAPDLHLVMRVPGRLELICGSIEIARGKPTGEPVVRSYTDYAYFVVTGSSRPSLAALLEALGAPADARIADRDLATIGPLDVEVGGTTWLKIFVLAPPRPGDYAISISRGSIADADWHRAQELPVRIAATAVTSAWEFSGTPAQWARAIG